MAERLFQVGTYQDKFNSLLELDIPCKKIMQSEGLSKHILNRHPSCADYISCIPEIIENPDYIGKNPREPDSIELIKVYDENILLAIKLDKAKDYLYVASLYDISQSKIEHRLQNKRIVQYE